MLVPLQGAAAKCCFRLLLEQVQGISRCILGTWVLQDTAVRVVCAMRLGCWRCTGWLRDVHGSGGVGP